MKLLWNKAFWKHILPFHFLVLPASVFHFQLNPIHYTAFTFPSIWSGICFHSTTSSAHEDHQLPQCCQVQCPLLSPQYCWSDLLGTQLYLATLKFLFLAFLPQSIWMFLHIHPFILLFSSRLSCISLSKTIQNYQL